VNFLFKGAVCISFENERLIGELLTGKNVKRWGFSLI
jgi:hypothetical protein